MPTIWRSPLPSIDTTPALLHEEIFGLAERWPERVALTDATTGQSLTYGELVDSARRLAAGMRARGARPGDVLALVAGNSVVFPVVVFGALAAGLTVAPVSPASTVRELTALLERVGARFVVADPAALLRVREAASARGVAAVFATSGAEGTAQIQSVAAGAPLPPEPRDPGAVALLFSTGGTSGLPKSAAHTHTGVVIGLRQLDHALVKTEQDDTANVFSGAVEFPFLFGTLALGQALRTGGTYVTLPRFDLEQFLRAVQTHRVTLALGAPPLALALSRHPLVDRYDLSSLRALVVSVATIPSELARACQARLGCRVVQSCGMTEAGSFTTGDADARGSVGRLLPGIEAAIVDVASGRWLDTGQTGELWIRGPQLMRGYAGDDAATAAAIDPDGWLHTGDLARFDAMENLYLVDRVKDLITHGGHHVTPVELEAELQALPAVADAAVVGRPHPEVGEVPVAYVVLHHPVQPSDLIEHLAGRLAPWKRLWDVVVVDELPRSPAGKLLRRLILERDRERANSHAGEGAAEPARQAGADGLRAQEKGSAR